MLDRILGATIYEYNVKIILFLTIIVYKMIRVFP